MVNLIAVTTLLLYDPIVPRNDRRSNTDSYLA